MLGQNRYESPVPEEKKTDLRELLLEKETEKDKLARTAVEVVLKELNIEKLLGREIKHFEVDVNEDNTVNARLVFEKDLDDTEAKALNDLLYTIDSEARKRGVFFQVG